MTNPNNATAQQVEINCQVNFGLSDSAYSMLLNYQEPSTTTGLFNSSLIVEVPANTTAQSIDLSSLFTFVNSALVLTIADISSPGQQVNIGLTSSSARLNIAASGFMAVRVTGVLPTLYADNPSANTAAILQIGIISN